MNIIRKCQILELVVNGVSTGNNQTQFQFTDQPYLRDKLITGIEVYNATDVPVSPNFNAVISSAQMLTAFLTLYGEDPDNAGQFGEWQQYIPLCDLHKVDNHEDVYAEPFLLPKVAVIWEKSKINIVPDAFGNTTNLSFLFMVYFTDKK